MTEYFSWHEVVRRDLNLPRMPTRLSHPRLSLFTMSWSCPARRQISLACLECTCLAFLRDDASHSVLDVFCVNQTCLSFGHCILLYWFVQFLPFLSNLSSTERKLLKYREWIAGVSMHIMIRGILVFNWEGDSLGGLKREWFGYSAVLLSNTTQQYFYSVCHLCRCWSLEDCVVDVHPRLAFFFFSSREDPALIVVEVVGRFAFEFLSHLPTSLVSLVSLKKCLHWTHLLLRLEEEEPGVNFCTKITKGHREGKSQYHLNKRDKLPTWKWQECLARDLLSLEPSCDPFLGIPLSKKCLDQKVSVSYWADMLWNVVLFFLFRTTFREEPREQRLWETQRLHNNNLQGHCEESS